MFLCTGRNPAMLAPVLALGFDGAVAGAGGYVFTGDRVLFDCPMEKEEFETGLRPGQFCADLTRRDPSAYNQNIRKEQSYCFHMPGCKPSARTVLSILSFQRNG